MKKFLFKSICTIITIILLLNTLNVQFNTLADTTAPILSTQTTNITQNAKIAAGLATPYDIYEQIEATAVPDAVGYDRACEKLHTKRLYAEEGNSLYNAVFENADGTRTMYVFDYPIKYITNTGKIKDISLEIDKNMSAKGAFVSADTNQLIQTSFSSVASDGIKLSDENTEITLVPLSLDSIPISSIATQKDSKTIAYNFDEKTHLEYQLTYTGFKEDIVVSEYTGQTEYKFKLCTGGLLLKEINNSYYLVDSSNNICANIGDIIIFTDDEKNNSRGKLSFETIKDRYEYIITIHVDRNFLSNKNTKYPIRIDPSIELNYSNNGASAIHDVTLNSNYTSDCTSTALSVGRRSNTYGISRILMKFPGLNLSSISSASSITEATVEIRDLLCESESLAVQCYVFTGNSWDQTTVTWANVDANNYGQLLSTKYISYSNGLNETSAHRYSFDITKAVRGWKLGNYSLNKGIIFKAPTSVENATTSFYKTIAAYNRSAYRPSLSVTYANDATQIIADGSSYYINNHYTGRFLCYESSDLVQKAGPTTEFTPSAGQWKIQKTDGGYVIRNSTNYLSVPTATDTNEVTVSTITNSAIPETCLWNITFSAVGGCIIRSAYSSRYLYTYGGDFYTETAISSTSNWRYYTRVWRIADRSLFSSSQVNSICFNDVDLLMNNSHPVLYRTECPLGSPMWSDTTDFSYTVENTNIATIDFWGNITPVSTGETEITLKHKPTEISTYFKVYVYNGLPYLGTLSTWRDSESTTIGYWELDNSRKIYYYIDNKVATELPQFTTYCNNAIAAWESALSVDFVTVSNADSADITIYCANRLYIKGIFGYVSPNWCGVEGPEQAPEADGYYKVGNKAKIRFKQQKNRIGIIYESGNSASYYFHVITHELGHALGFEGHSSNSNDIMHPNVSEENPKTALSSAEINHLLQVY